MPAIKKPSTAPPPWYRSIRYFQTKLYHMAKDGCTLKECANFFGVNLRTVRNFFTSHPETEQYYRRGLAAIDRRTRQTVAFLALGPDDPNEESIVGTKEQIQALQLLVKMRGLDRPRDELDDGEDDDVDTLAAVMLKAERIEIELDKGERKTDPVTGRTALKLRSKRPVKHAT